MSEIQEKTPRVLSIQSHVVSGYVGNKSATFPLQLLGFEVDTINSVQFSNHTGYGYWTGQILTEKELDELFDGLAVNKLHHYDYLLTGYIASASFLKGVVKYIKELKVINPDLIYTCDPVMGDNGKMYVPEELLAIYRDEVIPLADILTPNQTEAELLTGEKIQNLDDALRVIKILHDRGIKTVALSSSDLGTNESLLALGSSISENGVQTVCKIDIPKLPGSFVGTGDLFAALFLAWWYKTSKKLLLTLESTVSTMQAVLRTTLQIGGREGNSQSARLELRLIESKRSIEQPVIDVYGDNIKN